MKKNQIFQAVVQAVEKLRRKQVYSMARSGENIYLRKDGRYEGRYIKSRKEDGKIIYGYVYAKRLKECKKKLLEAKIILSQKNQNHKEQKIYGKGTVGDYMGYWLNHVIKETVKESTYSNYVHQNKKWIAPKLGAEQLHKLTEEQVQRFINELTKGGLTSGSVKNIYRMLNQALKKARDYGYIKNNPCEKVILPENKTKKAETLSKKEQKQLETFMKGRTNPKTIDLIVFIALYAGLRIGEICALTWEDIDFKQNTISITKTRQRIQRINPQEGESKTYIKTGSAKSGSSQRIIPVPLFLMKMLRAYKQTTVGEGHVFIYKGKALEPRIIQYRFKSLLKEAGIKQINFHALRHTFATCCMIENVDIKTISELLGHSSAKITLDLYTHSRFEQKQVVMKKLQKLHLAS